MRKALLRTCDESIIRERARENWQHLQKFEVDLHQNIAPN
jgi:hypothetical protein